jgi:aspartate aminotransferase
MFVKSISKSILRQQSRKIASSSLNGGRCMSTKSPWADFEMAPVDPIVGLNEIYNKDDFPSKVIVGVGAYRDDAGKPYVLPCVREAEKILMDKNLDMEYTGIVSQVVLNLCCENPTFVVVLFCMWRF